MTLKTAERRNLAFRMLILTSCMTAFSGCRAIQQRLRFVDLSAGAEYSDARFFVRASGLEKDYSTRDVSANGVIELNKGTGRTDYFYSVGSFPGPLPFIADRWIGRYMRTSVTLNSPRTFRGTLLNFPDDNRVTTDPIQATLNLLVPLPGILQRKTEFVFEEYRAYVTFFIPYFSDENWYFGIGHSLGQSRYNLDLIEGAVRVASTRNAWIPLYATQLTYGYRIGRFFEEGLLHETYLYMELIADSSSRPRLDVNLQRSDGLPGRSLYYQNNYARIGIRKTVDLWTDDEVVEKRKKIKAPVEDQRENENQEQPPETTAPVTTDESQPGPTDIKEGN